MPGPGYRLYEQIGKGGYGRVFRARLDNGQIVAIKRLSSGTPRRDHIESFHKESMFAGQLDHPNIVAVMGVDEEHAGRLSLIMEFVDGVDLMRYMGQGRLSAAASLYIGRALLSALAHAHETARLVHRDVSPHNVLISWNGEVKLSDFGVAKLSGQGPTKGGQHRGKNHYMSPEQWQGCPLDARSDLFAAGIILYQLFAGRSPLGESDEDIWSFFSGATKLLPLHERCPELPPELCAVVMRLLEYDPTARHESARAVLDVLPDWPHGRDELVAQLHRLRELGAFTRRPSRRRTRRLERSMLAAALLLGLGVGMAASWQLWRPEPPATSNTWGADWRDMADTLIDAVTQPPATETPASTGGDEPQTHPVTAADTGQQATPRGLASRVDSKIRTSDARPLWIRTVNEGTRESFCSEYLKHHHLTQWGPTNENHSTLRVKAVRALDPIEPR
ncbi:MAG: serine/threonine protein kinase [Nitrospira sp.]|nr:serine/threonine protein kinase [Nitrospira sp.]